MQSSCMRLMGKMLLVSLALEGKFCREGLQSLEEDDDMLTAMARELVTERGIGDSANEVWRQIQAEHGMAPTAPTRTVKDEPPSDTPPVLPAVQIPVSANAPRFGTRAVSERPARRRESTPTDAQFSLF